MKSICYVVLPEELSINNDEVYVFIRKHIGRYHTELEVEPYKKFFTCEETLDIAARKGFNDISEFEDYLKEYSNEDGVEDGLYYWITTWNSQGEWDYFIIEGVKRCNELKDGNEPPYSVVTPDGVWHSERDYGYSSILDFNIMQQHPDNIEPEKNWKIYLEQNFFNVFSDRNIAVLLVHS